MHDDDHDDHDGHGSQEPHAESRLEIPFAQLSQEALLGVIDDYVLREGTDYGQSEPTLEQKRARVLAQLQAGTALVIFDASTETCTIVAEGKRQI